MSNKSLLLDNSSYIKFKLNSFLESFENGIYKVDCFFQIPVGRGFKKDEVMITIYKVGEYGVNVNINVETFEAKAAKTQGKYNKEDTKTLTNLAYWLYIFHLETIIKNTVTELMNVKEEQSNATEETTEQTKVDTVSVEVAATVETVETQQTTVVNVQESNTYTIFNRSFPSYAEAYDYCISSDFDPSYIVSDIASNPSHEPLRLNLQLFSSNHTTEAKQPTQRKIYESGYDSVKIITKHGEHIARIHPSEDNETQHIIFYSSDDSFPVNDSDIISVVPIYKKVITTNDGITKRGIGKGLELLYIIETTKNDPEIDELNFSNVHQFKFNSIQSALNYFNTMQLQGWHNIQLITEVHHKNSSIIEDYSDINLEVTINTSELAETHKENRTQKKYIEVLEVELEYYKAFIKRYKAEKTFESFIKESSEQTA